MKISHGRFGRPLVLRHSIEPLLSNVNLMYMILMVFIGIILSLLSERCLTFRVVGTVG